MRHFGEFVAEFFSPNAEAATTGEAYEIAVELPGIPEDEIQLEIQGERLVVTGEKRSRCEESGRDFYFSERVYGRFRRSFQLPPDADLAKVSAMHKDGVLTVTVGKRALREPDGKRIPIGKGRQITQQAGMDILPKAEVERSAALVHQPVEEAAFT